MKKQTRIGLMVLVTVVLILTLTVPGLAKKGNSLSCEMRVITVDKAGNLHFDYMFYTDMDVEIYYDENGILYNGCAGVIPFGEKINPGMWFGDFEDYCTFFEEYTPCENNEFTLDSNDMDAHAHVVDEDNVRYWSTWWSLWINSDGSFVGVKAYDSP